MELCGRAGNSYNIFNDQQFRVMRGFGDIGDHALQIGFEYEQRRDAFFNLSLWVVDVGPFDGQLTHQGDRHV